MNSEFMQFVKCYVEVNVEKEPNISPADMMKWLLPENQSFNLQAIKNRTLSVFIKRNMEKLQIAGTLDRKPGSGGSNKIYLEG